jgi:hypothetical protein
MLGIKITEITFNRTKTISTLTRTTTYSQISFNSLLIRIIGEIVRTTGEAVRIETSTTEATTKIIEITNNELLFTNLFILFIFINN